MTLDTSCVIHAAQEGRYAEELAELVSLAQAERVGLYLTGAFDVDMEKAKQYNKQVNFEWLQKRPIIRRIPQPFRFDFSPLGDPRHALMGGSEDAALVKRLEEIVLPTDLRPGKFNPAQEPHLQARFRRKVADVQHLGGHMMSGNDYFVTTDADDMIKKRDRIREATGIRIIDPTEAATIARLGRALSP
ncbi:hypothetical protein [Micromonospora aurantiaca (nom. illeg.)]|uniref:hypothetical protein n=1 Tax=Micromonospora aurantiaca (nom. illeg.) TaxID=47850 RepID=UPI003692BD75